MKARSALWIAAAAALLVGLMSCDVSGAKTDEDVAVTGVSLPAAEVMVAGTTKTLAMTISPANATNKQVSWASSDEDVATVAPSGLISARAAGSTTISVQTVSGGKIASCELTVTAGIVAVTGVEIPESASVAMGESTSLQAVISPMDATNRTVSWASADEDVATVDAVSGLIIPVSIGSTVITVTSADGGHTDTCTVTVTAAVDYDWFYQSTGEPDISHGYDTWGNGPDFTDNETTQAGYAKVIKVTGNSWGSVVAFTRFTPGKLAEYTHLTFKIKGTGLDKISIKVPDAEKEYKFVPLAGAAYTVKALADGWFRLDIPIADFGTFPLSSTEFAIMDYSKKTVYLADVGAYGVVSTVDQSFLDSKIEAAKTLRDSISTGTGHGEIAQADKDAFSAAISAAEGATLHTQADVSTTLEALLAAQAIFSSKIIILAPASGAAAPGLAAEAVISLHTSSNTYTNITVGNWNPGWDQGGSLTDYDAGGKVIKNLDLKNYQGIDFTAQNITGKTTLHLSYWTLDASTVDIYPINTSATGIKEYAITAALDNDGEWHDLEIVIDNSSFDLSKVNQLKFVGTNVHIYLDNIYFH